MKLLLNVHPFCFFGKQNLPECGEKTAEKKNFQILPINQTIFSGILFNAAELFCSVWQLAAVCIKNIRDCYRIHTS